MSKFKIKPAAPTGSSSNAEELPLTREAFASGAAMVQSQSGGRPPKPVRINFDLDPDLHRRLKIRAVTDGKSVAELVRQLIEVELER